MIVVVIVALVAFGLGLAAGAALSLRVSMPIWRRSVKEMERSFEQGLNEMRMDYEARLAARATETMKPAPRIVDTEFVEEQR